MNDKQIYIGLFGFGTVGKGLYDVLKKIDPAERRCELGLCLVNDRYKNHGYGTLALRQGLRFAFEELGLETVLADSLLRNTRSQRALQKAGFRYVSEDEHFKYYQIRREETK